MTNKQAATMFADLMSRAISIAEAPRIPVNELRVTVAYEKIEAEIVHRLDDLWSKGLPMFFNGLKKQLAQLETAKNRSQAAVQALCISQWMDQRLTYEPATDTKHLSLYPLLPIRLGQPVCCDGLNTNAAFTGNTLHPKYDVVRIYDQAQNKLRPLSTRDAFKGINGLLHHVCYTGSTALGSTVVHVHDIVVPCEYKAAREAGQFRVAFSPMSNDTKLLNLTNRNVKRSSAGHLAGIHIDSVNSSVLLYDRFLNGWRMACENQVDLFFGPEMLGFDRLYQEENGYNRPIFELAQASQSAAPMLTVLPSRWKDGINQAAVVYQTGKLLGIQRKLTPFYDLANHKAEALSSQAEWSLLLIHIPGLSRIVIMICADFLEMQHAEMRELICGELGATLIIVPSYSRGEEDFIRALSSLQSYGATVVWGDCCGAVVGYPRIIGACGLAGVDTSYRFGNACDCGNGCTHRGCLFTVDLPLHLTQEKPGGSQCDGVVRHHLRC